MFCAKLYKLVFAALISYNFDSYSMKIIARKLFSSSPSSLQSLIVRPILVNPVLTQQLSYRPLYSSLKPTYNTFSTQYSSLQTTRFKFHEQSSNSKNQTQWNKWGYSAVVGAATATGFALDSLSDKKTAYAQADKNFTLRDCLKKSAKSKQYFYKILLEKPWVKICEKYIKQLEIEEAEILNEFIACLGITPTEFAVVLEQIAMIENIKSPVDKTRKEIFQFPTGYQDHIKTLFEKYCPDFKEVIFKQQPDYFGNLMSIGYTHPNTILTIESTTFLWPQDRIAFLVIHEIQHVLHDQISFPMSEIMSPFEDKNVAKILSRFKIKKTKELQQIYNRYEKFKEKRADILAGLVNPEYAKAWALYIKERQFFERMGWIDLSQITHPTYRERFMLAVQIYQEIMGERAEKIEL